MVMTGKKWTETEIMDLIARADRPALFKMLWALYQRQTNDEQAGGETRWDNGVGFSGTDAKFLSSVAKGAESYKSVSERQAPYIRKALIKYRKQLVDIANANEQKGKPAPGTEDNYHCSWGGRFAPKQMEIPNPYPTGPATVTVPNPLLHPTVDVPKPTDVTRVTTGSGAVVWEKPPAAVAPPVAPKVPNKCRFCSTPIANDKQFCSDGCKNEWEMHEIVRKGELEENKRVAQFKMRRDEILQNPYSKSWKDVFGTQDALPKNSHPDCKHDFQDYPSSAVPELEKRWGRKYRFTPGQAIRGCHNMVCTLCGDYQFIDSSD